MTTFRNRQRREALQQWLDRAATADQIVGYALVAILIVCLGVLLIESMPAVAHGVLAWITK